MLSICFVVSGAETRQYIGEVTTEVHGEVLCSGLVNRVV
jgi:hypothetical protein